MKEKLIYLLLLIIGISILFGIAIANAATLTIDIPGSPGDPNSDVSRVSVSFGEILQLGRKATMQEVSSYTQAWIIDRTKSNERQRYNNNYVEIPLAMQPTPSPTPTATP